MDDAIGAVLTFGIGVGVSPVPIIAVILVLFSERARVNGPMFAFGWVLGLSVVVTAIYLLAEAVHVGASDTADEGVSWLRIAAGGALLATGARTWQKRPAPGTEPTTPGWMATIDQIQPSRAFGLAAALAANPKNLLLAAGAASAVATTGVTSSHAAVALAAFVAIGSAVVISAVVYHRVGGASARRGLDRAKGWFTRHNAAVMAVVLVLLGLVLLSQGLRG